MKSELIFGSNMDSIVLDYEFDLFVDQIDTEDEEDDEHEKSVESTNQIEEYFPL